MRSDRGDRDWLLPFTGDPEIHSGPFADGPSQTGFKFPAIGGLFTISVLEFQGPRVPGRHWLHPQADLPEFSRDSRLKWAHAVKLETGPRVVDADFHGAPGLPLQFSRHVFDQPRLSLRPVVGAFLPDRGLEAVQGAFDDPGLALRGATGQADRESDQYSAGSFHCPSERRLGFVGRRPRAGDPGDGQNGHPTTPIPASHHSITRRLPLTSPTPPALPYQR